MITKKEADALGLVAVTDWLPIKGRDVKFKSHYGSIRDHAWLDKEVERIRGYVGTVKWQQDRVAEVVEHPEDGRRAYFVNPVAGPGAPEPEVEW